MCQVWAICPLACPMPHIRTLSQMSLFLEPLWRGDDRIVR